MLRSSYGLLPVLAAASILVSPHSLRADDAAKLNTLSEQFEKARAALDIETIEQLTLPEARWIQEAGSKTSNIVSDLKTASTKRSGNKSKTRPANVVVGSDISVHGDSAVMTQLIGMPADRAETPLRRSIFWVRDGDAWKIAHIHASPYLRWQSSISDFEAKDSEAMPATDSIVFIGSSSVRRWDSLPEAFPGLPIINRGFGGSQMADSVLFSKRIVTPYAPSAVAVYAGDNDIGGGKRAEQVLSDFKKFVTSIHSEVPDSKIGFIAIKPSLKRWHLWPEMLRANLMVKNFAADEPNVAYLDIASPMLGEDGKPRKELFASDGLHLNPVGYEVWANAIKPWMSEAAALSTARSSTGVAGTDGAE